MTRKQISLLIFVDLLFLGGMGLQVWDRYQALQGNPMSFPVSEQPPALSASPQLPVSESGVSIENPGEIPAVIVSTASVKTPSLPAPEGESPSRRTFVFHNPNATSVQLVGDFNQWTPQDFQKGATGRWKLSVVLAPGDYAYNFIVDGKVVRDPNQRRTDAKGRSLLTVGH